MRGYGEIVCRLAWEQCGGLLRTRARKATSATFGARGSRSDGQGIAIRIPRERAHSACQSSRGPGSGTEAIVKLRKIFALSVAAGDVNGDGSLGLLVANECSVVDSGGLRAQRRVGALLGNGDGTFQTAVSYSPGGSFQFCKIPGRWGSGGRFTCTG